MTSYASHVLIRAATFDLFRCIAFACVLLGIGWSVRRRSRGRPTVRAELPVARTGDPALVRLRAFCARVAPVVLSLAGVAALAAASQRGHRALVLTERNGTLHAEPFELVGTAKDLDAGDVWVVNRTTHVVSCNHFGDVSGGVLWVWLRREVPVAVIAPGEGVAVRKTPVVLGPDEEIPAEVDDDRLWLRWTRD